MAISAKCDGSKACDKSSHNTQTFATVIALGGRYAGLQFGANIARST